MSKVNRIRPRIGDVIEFQTPRGTSYALFTHEHKEPPRYGSLLRVFRGFHDAEPEDYSAIVNGQVLFSTFFPLGAACSRKIVRIVANEDIPKSLSSFPIFKAGLQGRDGKIRTWFLWDGKKEWRVPKLERPYYTAPHRGVVNETWIIDRLIADIDEVQDTIQKNA